MQVAEKASNSAKEPSKSGANPFVNPKKDKFLLICVSLSINILSLALPITMLHFYDRILPRQNVSTMIVLVACVVTAILLEAGLKLLRSYMLLWSSASFEHNLVCRSIKRFINADLKDSDASGSGEYLQRIAATSKLKDFYSGQLIQNYIDVAFVFVFLSLIAYLSGVLVLVPLTLLVTFIIILAILNRKIHQHLNDKEESDEKRYNFIIEALNGMHTIKSLGLEPVFSRRYESLEENSTIANHNHAISGVVTGSFGSLFNQIMIAGIVFFGALMAIENKITMGTLVAVVLLTGRTIPPIQGAMMTWLKWHDFTIAKNNIMSFFRLPQIERSEEAKNIEKLGKLEVSKLVFSYKNSKNIIDKLDLTLKKGEVISISGGYSSGKTTLLKLFAGLLLPNSGNVIIDGVEAHKYSDKELGRHIAYMSTDTQIFKGTIRENLTAFRKDDIEEKALELASLLKIDKEIMKLPDGYDSILNDTLADPISPGLKQRVSIARVLALKPKILLFDNADKSLDKEGYECVVSLIGKLKGKATIIIISDDRNILNFADREYVLENGKLIEKPFDHDSKFYDLKPNQEFKL